MSLLRNTLQLFKLGEKHVKVFSVQEVNVLYESNHSLSHSSSLNNASSTSYNNPSSESALQRKPLKKIFPHQYKQTYAAATTNHPHHNTNPGYSQAQG